MLKTITSTATWKQSLITISGTAVNGFLGALFYILMARFLGPSDFGLLTISITTLTLIGDIADLGTNTGLIRFASLNISGNIAQALKFLKASLLIKLVVWVLVLSLGFFLSPLIATNLFDKPQLAQPLQLVMFGVGGALLFSFTTSSLQAYQKFFWWSLVNVSMNLLRVLIIIFLINLKLFDLFSGLSVYILMPFLGFFLGMLLLPARQIFISKIEGEQFKQLIGFNGWVALFTAIAALSSRMDVFLNARLLPSSEVGIYGAALQLPTIIPQLVSALGTVAAPKFASFQNITQMKKYLIKFQLFVLGVAGLTLLAIPIVIVAFPWLYGQAYSSAIPVFVVIFLAMLVFLISLPIHTSVIYFFSYPKLFVWISLGHLLIMTILGYLMIVRFGVFGIAVTVLTGNIFNLIVPLIWVLNKLRKND